MQDTSNSIKSNANESAIITPLIVYDNADVDKLRILTDNKKKAGIYQREHKESSSFYIGSSFDLSKRLKDYYKISFMSSKSREGSYIYNAIYHTVILILALR